MADLTATLIGCQNPGKYTTVSVCLAWMVGFESRLKRNRGPSDSHCLEFKNLATFIMIVPTEYDDDYHDDDDA